MDNKGNKQWVWLALDADPREIVGVYIGARSEAAARKLWNSLPGVYLQLICGGFLRNRCHANARLLTPNFGQPMEQFYRASAIERWERRAAKRATLND